MVKPTDFLMKKWDRVFYMFFDVNKNGVIDWGDFELLFNEIKELRGEQSNEFKICQDAMLMVWRGLLNETKGHELLAESGEEEEITKPEWEELWSHYNPKKMQIWQWEYLKYMFFLLDSSGDKFIDEKEYTEVMKIYKIDPKDSKIAFKALSVGKKDGMVDYGDFVRLFAEYFSSDDPKAPGSSLFGPPPK